MLGGWETPKTLLPQKRWGREAQEMREKVRVGDRRHGETEREAEGRNRAQSCQEQTKVKEER